MTSVEELIHATASRALDQQERQVSELRARTGTLLAAAALAASFLGANALQRDGITPLAVAAVLALVLALGLCLSVLVPHTMIFALDARELHDAIYADIDDPALVHVRVAYYLHDVRAENQPVVDRLFNRFRLAALALGAEIALWVLALALS